MKREKRKVGKRKKGKRWKGVRGKGEWKEVKLGEGKTEHRMKW
jgi:hypothetical protein